MNSYGYQTLILKNTLKQTTATGIINRQKCRLAVYQGVHYACLTDLDTDGLLGRISDEKWKNLYNLNDIDRSLYMIQRTSIMSDCMEKCELCAVMIIEEILFDLEETRNGCYTEAERKQLDHFVKIFDILDDSSWFDRVWDKHMRNDTEKLSPFYPVPIECYIQPKQCVWDHFTDYDMRRWETVYMKPFHPSREEEFNRKMESRNKIIATTKKLKTHDPTNPHFSLIMNMLGYDEAADHCREFRIKMNVIYHDHIQHKDKQKRAKQYSIRRQFYHHFFGDIDSYVG